MLRSIYFVCLLVHVSYGFLKEKPAYVHTCYKNQPNLTDCSTEAVQTLFNHLPKGEPAIGLEPLDPLKVDKLDILQGGNGPVTINASLANGVVSGFGKAEIVYNKINTKTFDFVTKLRLAHLRIEGDYKLRGKILVVPLRGNGNCWFDSKNLNIVATTDVNVVKREGYNFFNVTGMRVKFSIGGLKLHLGNLFEGIKALEETTNMYLNNNWRPIVESLSPILTKTIENLMLEILRPVFDNIPADYFIGDIDEELLPVNVADPTLAAK